MTNINLNKLTIEEKIVVWNYVQDELQIKRSKDGKMLVLYDGAVDIEIMVVGSEWINKKYNELLKYSNHDILIQILKDYYKFKT